MSHTSGQLLRDQGGRATHSDAGEEAHYADLRSEQRECSGPCENGRGQRVAHQSMHAPDLVGRPAGDNAAAEQSARQCAADRAGVIVR